jgi:hypothetical protein
MLAAAVKKALPLTDCPFINEVIALVISWVAG